MKKHTPGPWKAYERTPDEFEIHNSTGGVLFRSTSYGKMREDARLIAAAPEMLAALKKSCWCGALSPGEECAACTVIAKVETNQ